MLLLNEISRNVKLYVYLHGEGNR